MKLVVIALILLSSSAFSAHESSHCSGALTEIYSLKDTSLEEVVEKLKECPTDKEIVAAQVKKDFEKFFGKRKINSGWVKGYKLKAPAGLLTVAAQMLGERPPKAWKQAAKECETLLCAFGKLFKSETAAMQILNFQHRTGYRLSLDQTVNYDHRNKRLLADEVWSAKEIQEMDAAAAKLPPRLKGLKVNQIDRYGDGIRSHGHGQSVGAYASPSGALRIYDTGLEGHATGPNSYTSTSWPQEVLLHELCHHHDYKHWDENYTMISERKGSGFGALSGWKKKTNSNGKYYWASSDGAKFVSRYASTSPAEDYAETCMNYVLHPQRLKKKAPEKYAYMKKYLFSGKEYTDKIWAKKPESNWPLLNDLLAKEDQCSDQIQACLKNVNFSYGSFIEDISNKKESGNQISSGRAFYHNEKALFDHECIKKLKKDYTDQFTTELRNKDENFCKNGGDSVIKQSQGNVCQKTIKKMKSTIKQLKNIEFSAYTKKCEAQKDYTRECIKTQLAEDKGIELNDNQFLFNNMLKNKLPKRLEALGARLTELPTNDWLKSCLKDVSDVDFWTTTQGKKLIYYSTEVEKVNSGEISRFIAVTGSRLDIQKRCSTNILQEFKHQGFKVSDTNKENTNLLLIGPFKKEFQSFETEVLSQIPAVTKKCLIGKKCKRKRIQELLLAWQAKDPDKRQGLKDSELVEKLLDIAKFRLEDL